MFDGVKLAFQHSLELVKSKWSLKREWLESSTLRIELFALEMQSEYGSYYKSKEVFKACLHHYLIDKTN